MKPMNYSASIFVVFLSVADLLHADAVRSGIWYEFQFLEANTAAFGCTITTCAVSMAPNTTFASDPPWTFSSGTPVQFILTDAFLAGDNFELFNNGKSLGITPPTSGFPDCGDDPVACSMNPMVSHRVYDIPAGDDSFTINVLASPAGAGTGFFMITPEPSILPIFLLAFLAAVLHRWRISPKSARSGALLLITACLAHGQSVMLLDPWSSLYTKALITTDVDSLATQGIPRTGVAADGATPLVVRFGSSSPATVCFALTDSNGQPLNTPSEDGALSPLANASTTCGMQTVSTVAGQYAFALYSAPSTFIRAGSPGDMNLPERAVFLTTAYTIGGQQNMLPPMPIRIVRPPVVLIHGLWDSAAGMHTLLINLSGLPDRRIHRPDFGSCYNSPATGYVFCLADYNNQNAAAFQAGAGTVLSQIRNILVQFRVQTGVAVKQVQVVAHSMGGVVTRTAALCGFPLLCSVGGGPLFYNSEVMRMITIGTPDQGSMLATFLAADKTLTCRGLYLLQTPFRNLGFPIDQGAIDDLRVNSPALQLLNSGQTPFPQHFIVGIAAASDEMLFNRGLLATMQNLCPQAFNRGNPPNAPFLLVPNTIQSIFNGIKSDLIVSVYSQRLGLRDMAQGTIDIMPLIHSSTVTLNAMGFSDEEKASNAIAQRVLTVLNNGPFINP